MQLFGYLNSFQVKGFIFCFIITLIIGPLLIPLLRLLKFGQTVRDDGPKSHYKKTGTPTMGGIIFLLSISLVSLQYIGTYPKILPILLVVLAFGAIGFIDDFIKAVKKRKDGLYPKQKAFLIVLISVAYAFYISRFTNLGTDIFIPFVGTISAEWAFVLFITLIMVASTNAVNITDGLDGLAAGVTLIITVFFTIIGMTNPDWEYIKIFSAICTGGLLGFLAFNLYPARVFMGDTGSLALGAAVAAIAIEMKIPLILLIVGFIYVIETLSDILQVASFKLTGKRIFKMAPLHHHFELSGWKETRVVWLFWSITLICCIIGFLIIQFNFY